MSNQSLGEPPSFSLFPTLTIVEQHILIGADDGVHGLHLHLAMDPVEYLACRLAQLLITQQIAEGKQSLLLLLMLPMKRMWMRLRMQLLMSRCGNLACPMLLLLKHLLRQRRGSNCCLIVYAVRRLLLLLLLRRIAVLSLLLLMLLLLQLLLLLLLLHLLLMLLDAFAIDGFHFEEQIQALLFL